MIDSHEMIMLERRLTTLDTRLSEHVEVIKTQNDKLDELTATLENVSDILAGIATSLDKIVNAMPPAFPAMLRVVQNPSG